MMAFAVMMKDSGFEYFKNHCVAQITIMGLSHEIVSNASISKTVWEQMSDDKKKIVLLNLNEINDSVRDYVEKDKTRYQNTPLFVDRAILRVLMELNVPCKHDENGYHFPKYGIL